MQDSQLPLPWIKGINSSVEFTVVSRVWLFLGHVHKLCRFVVCLALTSFLKVDSFVACDTISPCFDRSSVPLVKLADNSTERMSDSLFSVLGVFGYASSTVPCGRCHQLGDFLVSHSGKLRGQPLPTAPTLTLDQRKVEYVGSASTIILKNSDAAGARPSIGF